MLLLVTELCERRLDLKDEFMHTGLNEFDHRRLLLRLYAEGGIALGANAQLAELHLSCSEFLTQVR